MTLKLDERTSIKISALLIIEKWKFGYVCAAVDLLVWHWEYCLLDQGVLH